MYSDGVWALRACWCYSRGPLKRRQTGRWHGKRVDITMGGGGVLKCRRTGCFHGGRVGVTVGAPEV